MEGQVVAISYKNPDEERILRWAEDSGLVKLADKINRVRLESVGIISVGSQDTPWAVFENTRAFFKRLLGRLPWRRKK